MTIWNDTHCFLKNPPCKRSAGSVAYRVSAAESGIDFEHQNAAVFPFECLETDSASDPFEYFRQPMGDCRECRNPFGLGEANLSVPDKFATMRHTGHTRSGAVVKTVDGVFPAGANLLCQPFCGISYFIGQFGRGCDNGCAFAAGTGDGFDEKREDMPVVSA